MNRDSEYLVRSDKLTSKLTLDVLKKKASDIQDECEDFVVTKANSERNFRLNEFGGLTFLGDNGVKRDCDLTSHSLSQLSQKVGVPNRYLEKCITSGMFDLAQQNVNTWIDAEDRDYLVRVYKNNVRGLLSTKYSVCDTPTILDVVDSCVDTSDYDVNSCFLTSERLHLRFVSKEMLPINGEDLFIGLFLDSSDVGRNTLTVRFGIYKQVCTNGLIVCKKGGNLFEQRHIGITQEEFYNGLVASLSRVPQLTEEAIQWVEDARMEKAPKEEDLVDKLKHNTPLREKDIEKITTLMVDTYDDSKWGLINSITQVAQDYTLETRLELERYAGNLLVA